MFVQLNENNEIIASASFKVDDTFIETNKNIVRGFDGKLYFEGERTEEELAEEKRQHELAEKQGEIDKLQKYLTDTDYVVVKISEAMVSGSKQLINELKNKYADVLNEREEARKQINELEKGIKEKKEKTIEQIQEKDIISIEEAGKLHENVNDDQVKVADCVENI